MEDNLRNIANIVKEEQDQLKIIEERTGEFKLDFGANKDEAIVIEDSTRGLTAAYKAGIECVIVKNEFTITQDFSKASYFIDNLNELKTILD